MDCLIYAVKTKALIRAFIFAYAKSRFSSREIVSLGFSNSPTKTWLNSFVRWLEAFVVGCRKVVPSI